MKEIPEELRHNAAWRGPLYILEHAFPDQEDDVWEYVDPVNYEIHFKEMIANRAWSSTEMLLLQSAASLFTREFPRKAASR